MASGSRRHFLQTVSSAAVALPVAAAPPPPLPQVKFLGANISRLVIGTNPFFGYTHFNGVYDRFVREWMTMDQRAAILHAAEANGITAWQLHYNADTITLLNRVRGEGSKLNVFLLSDFEMQKDFGMIPGLARMGFVGMAHHGNRTDEAFREGKMERVREFVMRVKDTGTPAGVSMHNPEVMEYIESKGWPVDYYMTCLYRVSRTPDETRAALGGERPLGEPFLEKDPERMTAMVRKTKRPCLAFKLLGAGRVGYNREQIEAAFKFAYSNIKPGDACIVGMCPKFKDEIAENTEIVRQIHST